MKIVHTKVALKSYLPNENASKRMGTKGIQFASLVQSNNPHTILFSLTAKSCPSYLFVQISYQAHEKISMSGFHWLARKKWYELFLSLLIFQIRY